MTFERTKAVEDLLQALLDRLRIDIKVASLPIEDLDLTTKKILGVLDRAASYALASEALWDAYYGPGADPEDVEWSDIQLALDHSIAATARGEPNFVPGIERPAIVCYVADAGEMPSKKRRISIDVFDEVVRLDAASLKAIIADSRLAFQQPDLARKLQALKDGELLRPESIADFLWTDEPDDGLMADVRARYGIAETEMLAPLVLDGRTDAPSSPSP